MPSFGTTVDMSMWPSEVLIQSSNIAYLSGLDYLSGYTKMTFAVRLGPACPARRVLCTGLTRILMLCRTCLSSAE